jgi:hypothetical protein
MLDYWKALGYIRVVDNSMVKDPEDYVKSLAQKSDPQKWENEVHKGEGAR